LGTVNSEICAAADALASKLVTYRRDFHRHAEPGWMEFRTASLVARRLADLGFDVHVGREVICDTARMGLPDPETLETAWERAVAQGGDPAYLEALKGGFTGVVGVLRNGDGPTVGLRFDMDALAMQESTAETHRPAREGFASVNDGAAHACGHDGHTALGLGVAEVLRKLRDTFNGTVKLIFQPAEEGVRGAKSMVEAGVVDDVNYLLGLHLYGRWNLGEIDCTRSNFMATSKFDAILKGESAHAGGDPQAGKNALLAASTAVLNLYAIPRHRQGATRINVGKLIAGEGRNVICPEARLVIETRGTTTELNEYMVECATRVLTSAATMYDCTVDIIAMGSAQCAESDKALGERVEAIALGMEGFSQHSPESGGGSEDYTTMMRRVQERGGLATHIGLGAGIGAGGHHTATFDFDERAPVEAVKLLSAVTVDVLKGVKS
jgi:aminobenzoyl-glutamate utilization protein A